MVKGSAAVDLTGSYHIMITELWMSGKRLLYISTKLYIVTYEYVFLREPWMVRLPVSKEFMGAGC